MSASRVLSAALMICVTNMDCKTFNCNYAVDLWWLTVSPPTQSPTAAPSDSPSKSPTSAPTFLNETRTTNFLDDDDNDGISVREASLNGISVSLLLNPYPIDSCYAFNFTEEPFNALSIKYSCKADENTLVRNIYWDSLECDGDQIDNTEITASEQGEYTTFICNADENCAFVSIDIQSALTNSPTSEPTDSPTTAEPTLSPNTVTAEGEIMDDDSDILHVRESNSDGSDECDGSLGPNPDTEKRFSWKFAQNICIDTADLSALFGSDDTPNPTRAPSVSTTRTSDDDSIIDNVVINESHESSSTSVRSLGWFCDNDQYSFTAYNKSNCEGDAFAEGVTYKDDWCVFGDAAWVYVECGPTLAPTAAPTGTACDDDDDCDANELCVAANGECISKIADSDCVTDSDCNDGYNCNEENGFCFFSECDDNDDCADYGAGAQTTTSYVCSTEEGINDGDAYSFGVCIMFNDNGSGSRHRCDSFTAIGFGISVLFVSILHDVIAIY